MANELFQDVIDQMKDSTKRLVGVIEDSGVIIACNQQEKVGFFNNVVDVEMFDGDESFIIDGCTYMPFGNEKTQRYLLFVEGTDEISNELAKIMAVSFLNIKQYYDEKYDRANFIKNVILDNILPGDIYIKTRDLRLNTEASRVCMFIKVLNKTDVAVYDIIQSFFPNKLKDYVLNLNETDIVLVKEIKEDITTKDLEKLAASIVDTLSSDFFVRCVVGIGTRVIGIEELAHSFKEAQTAIEVSKVFDKDKNVVSYENLGIARLIYQLPNALCEMFMKEVFKNGSIDSLDQETLFTIQKFFENNLNVSETSRKLFVHRNTLVYRLDKILKLTGLDLREFEDAIVFKVALMVKKYLVSNPTKF